MNFFSKRIGFALLFLSPLGLATRDSVPVQPVSYNHQMHIVDVGFTCTDCHTAAESEARAGIPNFNLCADCHDDTEVENVQEQKVAQYVQARQRIPWQQVHIVPDHAYFSHRRHVTLGQLECATCHGDVEQMTQPFLRPYLTIEMEWCTDCHERMGAAEDCYACHR